MLSEIQWLIVHNWLVAFSNSWSLQLLSKESALVQKTLIGTLTCELRSRSMDLFDQRFKERSSEPSTVNNSML